MCGICGEIRFDNSPPTITALATMNTIQASHGHDATGILAFNHFAIARLWPFQ